MNAKQLLEAGRVSEAERALIAHLRDHPTDAAQRIALFEVLCFGGQFERAEKHLHVLAGSSQQAELGAILYFSALHGEKTRHEMFSKETFPASTAKEHCPGKLNGKGFSTIRDADPDIGARLEVIAAGAYMWLPFEHIASVQIEAPRRLRDTLWLPAFVRTGPSFRGEELGEVLIPVVYPYSWKHPEERVWLGQMTAWGSDDRGREVPSGQKLLMIDGEEVPVLEIRSIEFDANVPESE
jgi:type VI secretion system protein ImpE